MNCIPAIFLRSMHSLISTRCMLICLLWGTVTVCADTLWLDELAGAQYNDASQTALRSLMDHAKIDECDLDSVKFVNMDTATADGVAGDLVVTQFFDAADVSFEQRMDWMHGNLQILVKIQGGNRYLSILSRRHASSKMCAQCDIILPMQSGICKGL